MATLFVIDLIYATLPVKHYLQYISILSHFKYFWEDVTLMNCFVDLFE